MYSNVFSSSDNLLSVLGLNESARIWVNNYNNGKKKIQKTQTALPFLKIRYFSSPEHKHISLNSHIHTKLSL